MAITRVVLAKLSPTMEEGTIVKWNKKEGDAIKVGDVLAEIETDKANMEMEALGAGVLRKILVQAGGKAPIGALIGVIAEANEDIAPMIAEGAAAAAKAAAPAAPPAATAAARPAAPAAAAAAPGTAAAPAAAAPAPAAARAEAPQPQAAAQPASPAAQPGQGGAPAAKPAAAAGSPAEQAAAASAAQTPPPPEAPRADGETGSPAPAAAGSSEAGRRKASPLARSMAAHQNIDLTSVEGSGPGGRIVKRDIEAWTSGGGAARAAAAPQPAGAPASPGVAAGQQVPLSNMRKTIARRLSESKNGAPHFYVTVEIDMDAAVAFREQVQKSENTKVSFNDLIVKACAKALTRFPMVNASWGAEAITTHGEVHIGVAVAVPDGLIVPVVRNADRKGILEISREVKDLASRAKDRKLKPEEFMGSTFSISNLGMYDVTEFTAIINPPESCILAVGAVRRVPVVRGEEIVPGHRMKVTLSSDHRVVDGALAAQFLAEVRRLLESPLSILL